MPPLSTFDKTAIAVILSQAVMVPAANAATINVDAGCSLGNAIQSANFDISFGSCEAGTLGLDTIEIPRQTISFLSASPSGSFAGDSALPLVQSQITIQGNGSTLERSSADKFRLIAITNGASASLTLNSITLSNGYAYIPPLTPGFNYGYGGAIFVGQNTSVTLNNSRVINNFSVHAAGGFYIDVGAAVSINNTTISGNTANHNGGGLQARGVSTDISIIGSKITDNVARAGGGLDLAVGPNVTLQNTSISGNTASLRGGGIQTNGFSFVVQLNVLSSTIANNVVLNTAGTKVGGGLNLKLSAVTIANSTISGNQAPTRGSAIYMRESALLLRNSTVSDNLLSTSMFFRGDAANPTNAVISNSVIANSPNDSDCGTFFSNYITFSGNIGNWFESVTCTGGAGDGDPKLGKLAYNGGLTKTHAPLTESGLSGAANITLCSNVPVNGVDQRGEDRGIASCFTGAVEGFEENNSFFVVPVPGGKSVIFGL